MLASLNKPEVPHSTVKRQMYSQHEQMVDHQTTQESLLEEKGSNVHNNICPSIEAMGGQHKEGAHKVVDSETDAEKSYGEDDERGSESQVNSGKADIDNKPSHDPHDIPELWKTMSVQIRAAVAKSMPPPSSAILQRTVSALPTLDKDAMGIERAPTEYMIEITDELREITEVKMNQGALTHNRSAISLDILLNSVRSYNEKHPSSPVNIAPALHRSGIVSKSQIFPEIVADGLRPVEKLRLSSLERTYQKMVTRSTPLFQKAFDDSPPTSDTLMIEVKSSVAMSISLVTGLFLSFALGWFGAPFLGLEGHTAQAIVGLIMSVFCLVTEVGLVLVRATKLEKINTMRKRRRQRAVQMARNKLRQSPTPSTESTTVHESYVANTPLKED
eukprot:Protomagalhaensia_sp_Gyna_25__617@NODE_1290_length_1978_cov_79_954616_g1029_i0_p1_GENE_NODE_1290_length_1978_cov_79_954616_g1029_i0NODE_1290_length_1978_cov_79_954616_g1029_i0_p1_ORF_typecomplete_len388_score59_62Vma12/PF11712_8/1_9e08Phage_holin_3_6/PF07332_11/0_042Herpes_LMP1/PF05297_11/0_088DUF4405/PF14358_6/0_75_NODE_1290_length_1978_cov_79_954616_g1029_i07221885